MKQERQGSRLSRSRFDLRFDSLGWTDVEASGSE